MSRDPRVLGRNAVLLVVDLNLEVGIFLNFIPSGLAGLKAKGRVGSSLCIHYVHLIFILMFILPSHYYYYYYGLFIIYHYYYLLWLIFFPSYFLLQHASRNHLPLFIFIYHIYIIIIIRLPYLQGPKQNCA